MTDPANTTCALATFWHGPALPSLDRACLLSFARVGYDVTVYGYDAVPDLPAGLRSADAQAIADRSFLGRFRIAGRPSLSHFTDYFRYKLFEKSDATWIDTDLLCLRPFAIPAERHFLTRETEAGLNGAISRLIRGDGLLDRLIAETTALADRSFPWGATGPALISRMISPDVLAQACAPASFYPIHWADWWKPFLPEYRAWCETACRDANTLHLWNNIVERAGYWKDLAPPRGSFLHERLASLDLIGTFKDVLPEAVMKAMVANDANLRTADHMPMADLTRILVSRAHRKLRRFGGLDGGRG